MDFVNLLMTYNILLDNERESCREIREMNIFVLMVVDAQPILLKIVESFLFCLRKDGNHFLSGLDPVILDLFSVSSSTLFISVFLSSIQFRSVQFRSVQFSFSQSKRTES